MKDGSFLTRALERYGDAAADDSTSEKIIDAALRQFELFGIARSTIADITRRSRFARVTLYRRFPSKENLIEAVILRELGRFLTDLEREIDQYPNVENRLTEGFVFALEAIRTHALLNRLLKTEPERLLPYLTVNGSTFLKTCSEFLATRLAQDMDNGRSDTELLTVAELTVRVILSFALTPTTTVDLDDPDTARDYCRRYLAPALTGQIPRQQQRTHSREPKLQR
jgi:AcrR family transcriptional regulator